MFSIKIKLAILLTTFSRPKVLVDSNPMLYYNFGTLVKTQLCRILGFRCNYDYSISSYQLVRAYHKILMQTYNLIQIFTK